MKKFLSLIMASFVATATFASEPIIKSLATPYNISYVREANMGGESQIVASGYDGEVVCLDYEGNIVWMQQCSPYFLQDVCCYDIDDDGFDEVMCASADGTLYTLDHDGTELWSFRKNEIPFYSVTAMKCDDQVVIAVGGFDKNIYFLTPSNDLMHTVASTEYAITKGWGTIKDWPAQGSINFLRTIKDENSKDLLAVVGTVNANNGAGALYVMDVDIKAKKYNVLRSFPNSSLGETNFLNGQPVGYFAVNDLEGGEDEILLAAAAGGNVIGFLEADYKESSNAIKEYYFSKEDRKKLDGVFDHFGYRVANVQAVAGLREEDDYNYLLIAGTSILVMDQDLGWDKDEDIVNAQYCYNDMYVDKKNMKMVLASCQSGGNCVHVVDLKQKNWLERFKTFTPPGNITEILRSTADLQSAAQNYVQPSWEQNRPKVFLMSEGATAAPIGDYVNKYPDALNFMGCKYTSGGESPEAWNRDAVSNEHYRNARDGRVSYTMTSEQAVATLVAKYPGKPGFKQEGGFTYPEGTGAAYTGGHGNDPFYFSPGTWKEVLTQTKELPSVLVFPELPSDPNEDFQFVLDTLFMPIIARRTEGIDVKLYIRTKNIFWLSGVYTKYWEPISSGQYADGFIPSMEETSARTMDISIAGRLGVWASGCTDDWGTRCARDNPSHDRMRQNSHQMLPNHFLRNMIYHVSMGARYVDNFAVDQQYMSTVWDLIGSGLLFVPTRDQLISLSPVHLAMDEPHEDFMAKGDENKWTITLDPATVGKRPPFVFDRIGSGWTSAAVTEWDFSRYAAGVIDRRTNFLPPYENGLVLITPGKETSTPYRKEVSQLLHPIYRDIMKTYHTDGKNYIVNGASVSADSYYKTVESDIKESAEKLPLTVGGGQVAWVAAHSGPRHIRLTLLDGGYINPDDAVAQVKFHTVDPVSITDLVTGEKFFANGEKEFEISVPTGMVRFLDIEIREDL